VAQKALEELVPDECFALMAKSRTGRLVYVDKLGPAAIPVNYALADGDIVVRVEGGAKRSAMSQPVVAFQVDHIDEAEDAGWSVLVRGTGREVPIDEVPALLHSIKSHFPRPWAAGIHNVWLVITPTTVTGRRLGGPQVGAVV
jgi:nitroimidazol reductase NimA-like FMN-containing flavoprotein (pyridoxamine 5'-phosphate oxidase superfamily)